MCMVPALLQMLLELLSAQRCVVLCRYGYSSIWEMQEVVDNYTKANIPLDVMWGDIDYMERWRDFTFDPVNFPLPALQVRHLALLRTDPQMDVPMHMQLGICGCW